jgi:hypothetical protein
MPYGGDPVKELGPYVAKGCVVLVCGGLALLIIFGVLVGSAL